MSKPLDYKELLKKYMRMVLNEEGSTFVSEVEDDLNKDIFSQNEKDELYRIRCAVVRND